MSKIYAYLSGIGACVVWGLSPLYFHVVEFLSPTEIILHRIIWSGLCCALILLLFNKKKAWRNVSIKPKYIFILLFTGMLLSANWLSYVWAINNGHILETSLGYYITPLISVLLGTLVLNEKMRILQWFAVSLALIAVFAQIFILGKLPWVSVVLAFTFSLYGLIRKVAPVDAFLGMTIETWLLFPAALGWLIFSPTSTMMSVEFWQPHIITLVMLAGPLTLIPLVLFNFSAKNLPYSTVGFLIYVSPTLTFLLAIFYFKENLTIAKLITFSFIWCALALFSADSYFFHKRRKPVY